MTIQPDFVDELFCEQEISDQKIEELKLKHEKLRKGVFERLAKQQKMLDEIQTSLDFLYMHNSMK